MLHDHQPLLERIQGFYSLAWHAFGRENAGFDGIEFVDMEFSVGGFHQVQDREQRIAVFLDLRPFVPGLRILDRQRMQCENLLQVREFRGGGIVQCHPDKAIRALQKVRNPIGVEIGDFVTIQVGGAADEHERILRGPPATWNAVE